MSKAEEFRKKFGESENTGELQEIYNEIEKIGKKCSNYRHYSPLSYNTLKELKAEGFTIDREDGCYVIQW